MLVKNRLTKAGGIKSVVIRTNEVVVITREDERIVYNRDNSKQEVKQP